MIHGKQGSQRLVFGDAQRSDAVSGDRTISQFQSLCTALAATVGTGNIVGVAGAIAVGGPRLFGYGAFQFQREGAGAPGYVGYF